MPYDKAWFIDSLFGKRFTALTDKEFDYALSAAEPALKNVNCWCPDQYDTALSIKIALVLEAAGLGTAAEGDDPSAGIAAPTHTAYVIEDEVFDTKRKFKLLERPREQANAGPAAILEDIINRCKPPLCVGAVLAGGFRGITGNCCSQPADKTEDFYGYE